MLGGEEQEPNTNRTCRRSDGNDDSTKKNANGSGYRLIAPNAQKQEKLQLDRQHDTDIYEAALSQRKSQLPISRTSAALGGNTSIEKIRRQQESQHKSAPMRKKMLEQERKANEKIAADAQFKKKKEIQREKAEKLNQHQRAEMKKQADVIRQKRADKFAAGRSSTHAHPSAMGDGPSQASTTEVCTNPAASTSGSGDSSVSRRALAWNKIHGNKAAQKAQQELEDQQRKQDARNQAEKLEEQNELRSAEDYAEMRSRRLKYLQSGANTSQGNSTKAANQGGEGSSGAQGEDEHLMRLYNRKAAEVSVLAQALQKMSADNDTD